MTTLFDTSAVIAATKEGHRLRGWSRTQLVACKLKGPVIIPDMVYCELSVGMADMAEVDLAVRELALERLPTTNEALFRAGRAFKKYKEENAGPKLGVMPDFLIGAIAEVAGIPLVTANSGDFSSYFPNVQLIEPPKPAKALKPAVPRGAEG